MSWTGSLLQAFNPNAERSETALRSVLTSLVSVVGLLERARKEASPNTEVAKDAHRQIGEQEARFPREALDDVAGLFGRRLASADAVRPAWRHSGWGRPCSRGPRRLPFSQ